MDRCKWRTENHLDTRRTIKWRSLWRRSLRYGEGSISRVLSTLLKLGGTAVAGLMKKISTCGNFSDNSTSPFKQFSLPGNFLFRLAYIFPPKQLMSFTDKEHRQDRKTDRNILQTRCGLRLHISV